VAAADVGDERAPFELVDHTIQSRKPLADQVRVVAGTEEALASLVDIVDVLVPAEAVPGAGLLSDLRRVDHRAQSDLEEPGQIRRTLGIR
jgi:hypothetical protein